MERRSVRSRDRGANHHPRTRSSADAGAFSGAGDLRSQHGTNCATNNGLADRKPNVGTGRHPKPKRCYVPDGRSYAGSYNPSANGN